MPSLVRFLSIMGVLLVLGYAGMFALVSMVEPTQREFVVTVPQDRIGTKSKGKAGASSRDRLQSAEAGRLARTLESLRISR